jgi:hypothetical protein
LQGEGHSIQHGHVSLEAAFDGAKIQYRGHPFSSSLAGAQSASSACSRIWSTSG